MTYNFYDYDSLLGVQASHEEDVVRKGHGRHEPSFIRQSIYTFLVTIIYSGQIINYFYLTDQSIFDLHDCVKDNQLFDNLNSFTISAFFYLENKEEVILIDNFGDPQKVDVHLFYWMFGFTWGFHIIACVLTLCYYAAHPSSVPMNPGVKLDFWIFGKQIVHQNQVTIRTFQYHNQIILFQEAYELV